MTDCPSASLAIPSAANGLNGCILHLIQVNLAGMQAIHRSLTFNYPRDQRERREQKCPLPSLHRSTVSDAPTAPVLISGTRTAGKQRPRNPIVLTVRRYQALERQKGNAQLQ